MTKKRLSDLLKEEAGKTGLTDLPLPDVSTEAEPEVAPESRRSLSRRRGSAAALQSAASQPRSVAAVPPPKPETTAQPEAGGPSAVTPEGDPRIPELERALAAAEAAKAKLEKTIKGLQVDLAAQQSRLFELKDSLDKSQAELQEAKQTIINLSKASAPPPAPAPQPRANRSGVDIVPRPAPSPPSQPGYRRGVPAQAPLGAQPNSMISDADIGWVD